MKLLFITIFSIFLINHNGFTQDQDLHPVVPPCIEENTLCAMIKKFGDHNEDGNISALDASLIKKAILALTSYSLELDLNLDGVNDSRDSQIIQQYVAGLIDCNEETKNYQCRWHSRGGFCKNDPAILTNDEILGGENRTVIGVPLNIFNDLNNGNTSTIDEYLESITEDLIKENCSKAIPIIQSSHQSACKAGTGNLTIPPKFISIHSNQLVVIDFLCECECKDSISCDGIKGTTEESKRSSAFKFLDEFLIQKK